MTLPTPRLPGITEENLHDAAPVVRSLVIQRLEAIWRVCEPHIDPREDTRPDPRFIESGIRVLDRLIRLYRLDLPGPQAPEAHEVGSALEAVEQGLAALEERLL